MEFSDKIKALRKSANLTQDSLAKKLNITCRTLQKYEAGICLPQSSSIIFKLAEIFEVEPTYFFDEKEGFLVEVAERYGTKGQRQAQQIIEQTSALFAGGDLESADEEAFLKSITKIYFDSKEKAKKYTPKKYLKDEKTDEKKVEVTEPETV
jgi:transcriptional regulator with XRE-family HTH domain